MSSVSQSQVILVVDDNRENRTLLSRRLAKDGYRVLPAESGAQALETLELQPVSLVLLDLQMPDMDGLEVLENIRRNHTSKELPVFMVSANTEQSTKVEAIQRGANDYLNKPLEYDFLLAKLRNSLADTPTDPQGPPTPPQNLNAETLDVGQQIHQYRLLELLGKGGMGKVFLARDERLLREVALKVMSGQIHAESQQRFLNEARAVARISHPNVVTIFEIGEHPIPYLAMERVEGKELDDYTQGQPLDPSVAARLTLQIAEALEAVHASGTLHRDLKPSNIMVCAGERIKVMDFGLAKIAELNLKITRTGDIWGTPQFMSPEHFDPAFGEVDEQSDLFALSSIFYLLLTGRLPFQAQAVAALMFEITSKDPTPPHQINSNIPQALSDICMHGLKKPKEKRLGSATQLIAALRAWPNR